MRLNEDNAYQMTGLNLTLLAFGRAVRSRRVAIGVSQEQLALEAGLDRTYVGGVERGERNLSFNNLVKLARALAISPSKLLELAEGIDHEI